MSDEVPSVDEDHASSDARHDVFISYSHKDKTKADAICALLERDGIRCWIAPRDVQPGVEWARSIIRGINSARIFVLLFSNFSNNSPQVSREVERAANRQVPILPFRIEDVTPNETLEYFISSPHWMDALDPPLEAHIERLSSAVLRLLNSGEPSPPNGVDHDAALAVLSRTPPESADPAPRAKTAQTPTPGPGISPRRLLVATGLLVVVALAAGLAFHRSGAPNPSVQTAPGADSGQTAVAASSPSAASPAATDPATALIGSWSIADLGCDSAVTFSKTDGVLSRTFAGEKTPISSATNVAPGIAVFHANDGTRYRLDAGALSIIPAGATKAIGMTRCAG